MCGKIAKKWSRLAFAAGVGVASFGVSVPVAHAQYGAGYEGTICPENDVYSQGYVTALGDENARYPSLNRAFFCARQSDSAYLQGYQDGKECVRAVSVLLAEQYWANTPAGWTMRMDAIVGKATNACYDNNMSVARRGYYSGLRYR